MRRIFITAFVVFIAINGFGQDANAILEKVRTKFETINDRHLDVEEQHLGMLLVDQLDGDNYQEWVDPPP